ncbi:MAG: hypothetical protein JEZ02_18235 [Desulfatibacillum sp.]|nr:hypothetical protein [Desulfatibacillum sp.]
MLNQDQSTGDAREALCRAFPSPKFFRNFKENDLKISPRALKRILGLAESEGLSIPENPDSLQDRESAFLEFLDRETTERRRPASPAPGLGFAGFLRIFWDETHIKSAASLVENLNEVARDLDMAPVQESMVSRLKTRFSLNTPKKRNFIRLLCFWVGLYASHTLNWDYQTFQELPAGKIPEPLSPEPEGVRISIIVPDRKRVDWIRRELTGCLKYLQLHHLDARTVGHFERIVSIDLPKLAGPPREPKLYGKAIGEALALCHQVVVRWLLSDFQDPDNRLAVLISAGIFDTMESNIPLLLPASSPMGATIRISAFARLCACMAEAKVVFSSTPEQMEFSGYIEEVWEIKGFWPSYFEFVPQLLEHNMIPREEKLYQSFKESLYLCSRHSTSPFKAVAAINRYPQNSFVILEIFKTLLHRRMFQEANEVLSTLLAVDPTNIIARSMRIVAFYHLAMKHASDPGVSDMHFDRAVLEGRFVEAHCSIDDEEFHGELGRVHLGRALRDMLHLKNGIHQNGITLQGIVDSLKKSLECYEKGVIASPTGRGTQSVFWMIHLKSLLEIMQNDPDILNRQGPLTDEQGFYLKNATEHFTFQGWIDPGDDQHLFKRIQSIIDSYDNSSQFSAIVPYALYAFGAFLHDVAPVITVRILKDIVAYLNEAQRAALKVPPFVGLYSVGSCLCLIQSQDSFVKCAIKARDAVKEKYSEYLKNPNDDLIIPQEERLGLRLCLINLEHDLGQQVLFHEEESAP